MFGRKRSRQRYFVDPQVQGALILRVILYWIVCVATITLMLLGWRIVSGPARLFQNHFDAMWFLYGPALIASFVLLPLVVFDIVRLSNRFVGPLVRLRRAMPRLGTRRTRRPVELP